MEWGGGWALETWGRNILPEGEERGGETGVRWIAEDMVGSFIGEGIGG